MKPPKLVRQKLPLPPPTKLSQPISVIVIRSEMLDESWRGEEQKKIRSKCVGIYDGFIRCESRNEDLSSIQQNFSINTITYNMAYGFLLVHGVPTKENLWSKCMRLSQYIYLSGEWNMFKVRCRNMAPERIVSRRLLSEHRIAFDSLEAYLVLRQAKTSPEYNSRAINHRVEWWPSPNHQPPLPKESS